MSDWRDRFDKHYEPCPTTGCWLCSEKALNDMAKGFVKHALTRQTVQDEQSTAWFEDGEAFHAFQLLQQEREEWLRDQQAQAEYQQYLNQLEECEHAVD